MSKRTLNTREKRLLLLCLGTIVIIVNVIFFRGFNLQRKALTESIKRLSDEAADDKIWLNDRAFWAKRQDWLTKHMPYTDSTGRSQGQLLDELQNTALDAQLKVSNQVLHDEPTKEADYKEVSLSIKVRGDHDVLLRWLLSLQSPEKFEAMKTFDLQLDTKGKDKTPQAECNLTVARWFNPESSAEPLPAEVANPLAPPDPLGSVSQ